MLNKNPKRLSAEIFSSAQKQPKTKREQPKQRREWQYNAEKHKGKASARRVGQNCNFSRLHCLEIPKGDLSTKKTKPNIEK